MPRFEDLWVWERVGDRLPWYYGVATNRMPAKYLIARRIPAEVDLAASEEELWAAHGRATERFLQTWGAIRRQEAKLSALSPAQPSLMDLSVELVQRMLRHCNFCRWTCKVDRGLGAKHGTCQLESVSRVGSYFHHLGEELVFRGTKGSGTIFFTSCNLRCQFCVWPGTFLLTDQGPIRMDDLYKKSGFEVEYGDGRVRLPSKVYTFAPDGRVVKVARVFRHEYSGELVEVEPLYAPSILVTPGHEVLASEGPGMPLRKVRAQYLDAGHWLAIPRPAPPNQDHQVLDVAATLARLAAQVEYRAFSERRLPVMLQAVSLAKGGSTSSAIGNALGYHPAYVRRLLGRIRKTGLPEARKPNGIVLEGGRVRLETEKRPGIPARLEVSGDLAELLGYYCAEGHVTRSSNRPSTYATVLSFGKHERRLVERSAHLMRTLFGLEPRIVERRTTTTVEVGKTSLGMLLHEWCGSGAAEKRVPAFLFRSRPEIVARFLKAYAAGDGCVTRGYVSLDTVSEALAMGVFGLYILQGHIPSFNVYDPPSEGRIEGRHVRRSRLYYVKVNARRMGERSWSSAKHIRYRYGDDYILVPIHRVGRVYYSGPVYNLEVDDSAHAYTANFLAVGNCQNGDISHDKDNGIPVTPAQLAAAAWQLRMEGCHNINWVGGEPTVHLHSIVQAMALLAKGQVDPRDLPYVEAAKTDFRRYGVRRQDAECEGELNVPMLWNSNFFMSPEAMRILRPLIDVWLPDFKFGNDRCAVFLAKTPWYWETVSRNHKLVYDWGEDMVIRHLIMPGHVECCTKPVLRWIADHAPQALVNVMDQYHPDYACDPSSEHFQERYRELARRPYAEEILESYECARALGLRWEEVTLERSTMGLVDWPAASAR